MSSFRYGASVLAIAGAIVAATAPSLAAPVMSSAMVLKQAAGTDVEQVRWRGRGAAAGIGFAAGALVGSAIASSNRGYYGGGHYGGYYDAPAAYGGYTSVYAAPAPAYVDQEVYAAPVRPGRCWITTGGEGQYGYWAAC